MREYWNDGTRVVKLYRFVDEVEGYRYRTDPVLGGIGTFYSMSAARTHVKGYGYIYKGDIKRHRRGG